MRIFVGGLPYNIEEGEVRQQFEKFGTVASVNIITDKMSGRSKGFGFVDMENDEEANKAMSGLNGMELDGKKLTVNIAEDRKPREGGYNRGGNRGGGGGGYNKDRSDNNRW
jgi:RNA recognition motif-containing protein